MARGINKVILIGNLGNDPDVRHAANGNAIANLSVATDESYKDKQTGQLVPRTEWHRVVLFGKIAEIAGQYLKKGSKVYLEGRLQTRKWTDKENIERYSTEIVVDISGTMQMLDGRNDGGSSGGGGYGGANQGGGNYDGGDGGNYAGASGGEGRGRQSAPAHGGYGGGNKGSAIPEPAMDPNDDIPF